MTKQASTPTIREVEALWRGKPIVVSLHPRFLEVRVKGSKSESGMITYEDLLDICLMRAAKAKVGDVPKMRGRG